jgi:hypothetical protein
MRAGEGGVARPRSLPGFGSDDGKACVGLNPVEHAFAGRRIEHHIRARQDPRRSRLTLQGLERVLSI